MTTQDEQQLLPKVIQKVHIPSSYQSVDDLDISDKKEKNQKNKTIEYIQKCVSDHRDIDIYQFLAIYGGIFHNLGEDTHVIKEHTEVIYSTKDRIENVIKAIMCIFVQVAGVVLILYEFIRDNDRSICNLDNMTFLKILYKILAFCVSARVSYKGFNLFFVWKGIHRMRNYPDTKEFAPFFAWAGFIINKLVALAAIIGGWLIIFFSEGAYRMILSSVALVGLMELDDKLLHNDHYIQLQHKMSKHGNNSGFDAKECSLIDTKKAVKRFPINIFYWILAFLCVVASFYICICF